MDYQYHIALSFAGEQRDYVEEVALALQKRNISVFYDGFEEATLWGKNLYTHLRTVYRDRAKYTVIFCSEEYANKVWTSHELESAQERALSENIEYILPVRFDSTQIPGLPRTTAYLEASTKSPIELCGVICSKLGLDGMLDPKIASNSNVDKLESALKLIKNKTKFLWLEINDIQANHLECSAEIKRATIDGIKPALDYLDENGFCRIEIKFAYKTLSIKEDVMKITLSFIQPQLVNIARRLNVVEAKSAWSNKTQHHKSDRAGESEA